MVFFSPSAAVSAGAANTDTPATAYKTPSETEPRFPGKREVA